jgi:hypothetical protein
MLEEVMGIKRSRQTFTSIDNSKERGLCIDMTGNGKIQAAMLIYCTPALRVQPHDPRKPAFSHASTLVEYLTNTIIHKAAISSLRNEVAYNMSDTPIHLKTVKHRLLLFDKPSQAPNNYAKALRIKDKTSSQRHRSQKTIPIQKETHPINAMPRRRDAIVQNHTNADTLMPYQHE